MELQPKILVINGPNLNLLGRREPEKYGNQSLDDLVETLKKNAKNLNVALEHFQSNAEHKILDVIHQTDADFIIINPAALTHTSVALRDALLGVAIPFIELHISNVHSREPFRHHSFLSDVAVGVICGLGMQGYQLALQAAVCKLKESNHRTKNYQS